MSAPHPVHALLAKLEAERLKLVEKNLQPTVRCQMKLLESLDTKPPLTAVREEIEVHDPKVGWGPETGLD